MARKKLFQNQFYVEIDSQDATAPRPGTFFYGPILFEVNVVATVRPELKSSGQGYVTHKGRMVFDVQAPLPPDAFLHSQGFPPVIGAYEELVAVPGKMRPVVILSPEEANDTSILVVPSFKAANYSSEDLELIRAGDSLQHFHLPACPELTVIESVLEFQKIQAIRLAPKLVNPGNRKAGDNRRCILKLADPFLAKLRAALGEYLGIRENYRDG